MTEAQLTHYASWASIISLFMSVASLLYIRSIKHNITRHQRRRRIRNDGAAGLGYRPERQGAPIVRHTRLTSGDVVRTGGAEQLLLEVM